MYSRVKRAGIKIELAWLFITFEAGFARQKKKTEVTNQHKQADFTAIFTAGTFNMPISYQY